jgi:hypothetical protein
MRARHFRAVLMALLAALMLAAAPAIASGSGFTAAGATMSGMDMTSASGAMNGEIDGCEEGRVHHPVLPAHCLASCLAGMAATPPAVPFTDLSRQTVRAAPEPIEAGILVPRALPVDPPPPRQS